MESKTIRIQVSILFILILANFIAQIPYYFQIYSHPNNVLAQARGGLLLLFVFAVFLLASTLLFKRQALGYWLMVIFLAVEFLSTCGMPLVQVYTAMASLFTSRNMLVERAKRYIPMT